MPRYSSPITSSSGHGDVVHGICWSADGKQLATACEDMYVRVFDVADVCNREPKFRRIKAARIPVGAGFADAQADRVAVVMKGECRGDQVAGGTTMGVRRSRRVSNVSPSR